MGMFSQVIQLCREPLAVFVTLFLISLAASYVLFKLLDSRATIKREGWSAGGAIAGFLIILFGSWFALKPAITPPTRIVPLSVPTGFKSFTASDLGLAVALPADWVRHDAPTAISFGPKLPTMQNPMFVALQIASCSGSEGALGVTEKDLPNVSKIIESNFGMLALRGASVTDSYLGRKSYLTPIRLFISVPGTPMPVFDGLLRSIYDDRSGRCINFMYPDSEIGKDIASTLNITSPSF